MSTDPRLANCLGSNEIRLSVALDIEQGGQVAVVDPDLCFGNDSRLGMQGDA